MSSYSKQPVKVAMRFEEGRTLLLTYCTPQSNDIGEVFQVSMGIAKSTIDLKNMKISLKYTGVEHVDSRFQSGESLT